MKSLKNVQFPKRIDDQFCKFVGIHRMGSKKIPNKPGLTCRMESYIVNHGQPATKQVHMLTVTKFMKANRKTGIMIEQPSLRMSNHYSASLYNCYSNGNHHQGCMIVIDSERMVISITMSINESPKINHYKPSIADHYERLSTNINH